MTALMMTADKIGLINLIAWFKKLSAKMQARRLANTTIKELSRLSDRELDDMGLSRGDIRYIAEKHYKEMIVNANLKGWV